jgi:hypothetical protein
MSKTQSNHQHRKVLWVFLGVAALGIAVYIAAALITKRSLEVAGANLRSGLPSAQIATPPETPSSVVLLDRDTVALIVARTAIGGAADRQSSWMYAAHALPSAEARIRALVDYAAVHENAGAGGGQTMRLVPATQTHASVSSGTLVLRMSRDSSMMRTFRVY